MKHVDLSANFQITDEQLCGGRKLTEEQTNERFMTATHEAAHLVGATACHRSAIVAVTIAKTNRRDGRQGTFESSEFWPDHEAFVSLVGYAWEEQHGDVKFAAGDYHKGFNPRHVYMLDHARAFVKTHALLIVEVAAAILLLIPKHGRLDGKPLAGLVAQLRETWVTPYVSGYVNGKLDHAVQW
ncbi:MAG: hypothetical protein ACYC4S_12330 [Rhodoferax sp.]